MQYLRKKELYMPKFWPQWAGVGLLKLFSVLPFSAQRKIGSGLGWLCYKLLSSRRLIADKNLQACLPLLTSEARENLLKQHFIALGQGVASIGMAWWASKKRLKRLIQNVDGLENIEAAFARGKGVILLSAHFTADEMGSRLIAELVKQPLNVMHREQSSEVFEHTLGHARRGYLHKVILRNNVRTMIRCLKNNEGVYYLPDQNFEKEHSLFVPFMGVNTLTLTTTARFANINDCSVVPTFCYQRQDGKGFDIEFMPALTDYPSGDDYKDTCLINEVFETAIRKHPEQYFWLHRRFKIRPEGEPPFYD